MKILIDDGMQITVGTGIGKYSIYLYESLKKIDVEVDIDSQERENKKKTKGRIRYLNYINSSKYKKSTKKYDVIHYTNYAMPLKKNGKSKYIVTVHDLAAFLCPKTLPFLYRGYARFMIKHAMKHADGILTVSENVRSEIEKKFPKYVNKVQVLYPGLYSEINKQDYSDTVYESALLDGKLNKGKFFLFVGTVEKRKNVGVLLDAFIRMKKSGAFENYKLVLAGRAGTGYGKFEKIAKSSGMFDDIIFTGYVSAADCNKLYNEAAAYVFPSVYEGFGSIQLECMACHTPLILADIPTNREVSKDYGIYFDLNDIDTLSKAMQKIADGDYDYTEKNALADRYKVEYNWDNLVKQYLEFYKEVAKK